MPNDSLRSLSARLIRRVGAPIKATTARASDAAYRLVSEWEYLPGGWPAETGAGWADESVASAAEAQLAVLRRNVAGTGPLGVSHLPGSNNRESAPDHGTLMTYGYVLARVAHKRDALSILDWGGGLGHFYLYSKALLSDVSFDYHCFDVPPLCRAGERLLSGAHFHSDVDELSGKRFDLVICSSSLQYFFDWRATLGTLVSATGGWLYVARLPTVDDKTSYVVSQRPHSIGYLTEYPSWFINRRDFIDCAEANDMELVREFVYHEQFWVRGAPSKGVSRGFLLRPRAGSNS